MRALLAIVVVALLIFAAYCFNKNENFDIPLRSSSAWDWNLGPGYGAGYGTGYGLYGVWPASLPREPWKWWMWGRRPLIFKSPYTPVPQIDYTNAPNGVTKFKSNYNFSIIPSQTGVKIAVDGYPSKTLQLDRNRPYFFHIYTPGSDFVISDGETEKFRTTKNGVIELVFENDDPNMLYYSLANFPDSGGVIYLNNIIQT